MTAPEKGGEGAATEFLTRAELAKRLGISVRSIECLDLPTIRIGKRRVRYSWRQVCDHLERRAV